MEPNGVIRRRPIARAIAARASAAPWRGAALTFGLTFGRGDCTPAWRPLRRPEVAAARCGWTPRSGVWDAPVWARRGWVLVAVQVLSCGLLVEAHGWLGAPVLALFALVSAAGLRWSPPLPRVLACLFAAASVMNGAGWIWRLFDRFEWYDDVLHVATPFALVGALFAGGLRLGWIGRPRTAVRAAALGAAAGLAIGLAWEALEAVFAAFPLSDTLMDLAYDMAGAGLGCWLVWRSQSGRSQAGRSPSRERRRA